MTATQLTVAPPPEETDAEFRQWVREEFRHVREMQKKTNEALDLILQVLKKDEETSD